MQLYFDQKKLILTVALLEYMFQKKKIKKVESSVKKLLIEEKSLELQNLKLMKILARKSIKLEKI